MKKLLTTLALILLSIGIASGQAGVNSLDFLVTMSNQSLISQTAVLPTGEYAVDIQITNLAEPADSYEQSSTWFGSFNGELNQGYQYDYGLPVQQDGAEFLTFSISPWLSTPVCPIPTIIWEPTAPQVMYISIHLPPTYQYVVNSFTINPSSAPVALSRSLIVTTQTEGSTVTINKTTLVAEIPAPQSGIWNVPIPTGTTIEQWNSVGFEFLVTDPSKYVNTN